MNEIQRVLDFGAPRAGVDFGQPVAANYNDHRIAVCDFTQESGFEILARPNTIDIHKDRVRADFTFKFLFQ